MELDPVQELCRTGRLPLTEAFFIASSRKPMNKISIYVIMNLGGTFSDLFPKYPVPGYHFVLSDGAAFEREV